MKSQNLRIHHFPLERYQERYTDQLVFWEIEAFSAHGEVVSYSGVKDGFPLLRMLDGKVLDYKLRSVWAMNQNIRFINTAIPDQRLNVVWFSDFFHPGLEAIAYTDRNRCFVKAAFCWAQSFDQYDFTAKSPLLEWMRPYEIMALVQLDYIFVASTMLRDLIISAVPFVAEKVFVVGLPFNSGSLLKNFEPNEATLKGEHEQFDGVFASRLDEEKRPEMFLNLVKQLPEKNFAICSGRDCLVGDSPCLDELQIALEDPTYLPNLSFKLGLTKNEYYNVFTNSKVYVNTSLQDWVSYTLLEALTLGCLPVCPDHRSFPEALGHDKDFLYSPYEETELFEKFSALLLDYDRIKERKSAKRFVAVHDEALDRAMRTIREHEEKKQ